jgi:hypothetical protein
MTIIEEELSMMNKINPNLFSVGFDQVGTKNCPNCNKLMEWFYNKWICYCKETEEKCTCEKCTGLKLESYYEEGASNEKEVDENG